MPDKLLWIISPAIFSIIGMFAGYLANSDSTTTTCVGFVAGLVLTAFAVAGENEKKE